MKTKLLITILLSCFIISASAQIIHVPLDQPNIQAGINVATTGDTVLVDTGTYYENINFWGKAITVASNFILDGDTNYINNTIINGSQPVNPDFASVVSFTTGENTTSIISGFTITGGTGLLDASIPARLGGGIVCLNAGAKIIHNKIIANEVEHQNTAAGAGIACTMYLQSKWIVIEHNVIADNYNHTVNSWAFGGGIFIGAIANDIDLNARVSYNTIENNNCYSEQSRADGGGIRIEGSDGVNMILYFNNNLVKNNYIRGSSTRGAGLCGIMAGADIENNIFSGNYIDETSVQFRGAAICFKYPYHKVNIINNQISNNISPIDYSDCRGAVSIMDGYDTKIIVEKNIFTNNIAYRGAGFYSRRCYNLIVSNNLFYGNSAYQGAALALYHSLGDPINRPLIINNTFSENTAINAGGAIRFDGELNAPIIYNCIFWENEAPTGKDVRNESSLDLVVSYSDIDDISGLWNGEGNINEDPIFVSSGDFPFQINDYSPCIDAGTPDTTGLNLPEYDLAGEVRIFNDRVDMGAYEWNTFVGVEEFGIQNFKSKIRVYPNPFATTATIEYELEQHSTVQITVYNHLGERIELIFEKNQPKGKHQFTWHAENLPAGVYYCMLKTDKKTQTTKMIKLK